VSDPRARRVAALVDGLTAAHLDGLLLTGLPNIRYLTGFSGSSALLVVTQRDVVLITDFRYQTQVAQEVGELARIVIEPSSLWTGLWQQLAQMGGLQVLGFETAHILHRDFQRLNEAGSRWQWRPTVDLVETLRERKDETEIACIANAANVATTALERTLPQVRVGMTELSVAGILERELAMPGARALLFRRSSRAGRARLFRMPIRRRERSSPGTFS
jgi:Xaa-Pro aminopeptidase